MIPYLRGIAIATGVVIVLGLAGAVRIYHDRAELAELQSRHLGEALGRAQASTAEALAELDRQGRVLAEREQARQALAESLARTRAQLTEVYRHDAESAAWGAQPVPAAVLGGLREPAPADRH